MHATREAWLTEAAALMAPWFDDAGSPLTVPVWFSVGFPSSRALSRVKRTIGECWAVTASTRGGCEIFITPLLDDPLTILATVAHEQAHAALGQEVGHKAPFARLVAKLGLVGKATATEAGPDFIARVAPVLAALGPLPHSRLDPAARPRKKDGIRQLKVSCPVCGYVARTSRRWLDVGAPICPTDAIPMCEGDET